MTFRSERTSAQWRSLILESCAGAALCLATTCANAQAPVSKGTTPQPAPLTLADFEAGMTKAMKELENEPRFKGLSEAERRERIDFVAGNVFFATAHEVGHMLIQEMGLPVLGREEDAADSYASVTASGTSTSFPIVS